MAFKYQGARAEEVNAMLAQLTGAFDRHIGANLKGLYLHGSMAMGCFRPWSSDIDLLAVVFEPMAKEDKLTLVDTVMSIAEGGRAFRKVEFSVVTAEEAARAAHPIHYILHYSDGWHQAYKEGRADPVIEGGPDEDLAAHFMVTRQRGHALAGEPIAETFGAVPRKDYLKSVWYDIAASEQQAAANPAYTVLNLCRTLMYLETGRVGSKREGGQWATTWPELVSFLPVIDAAVSEYTTGQPGSYDPVLLARAVGSLLGMISPRFA